MKVVSYHIEVEEDTVIIKVKFDAIDDEEKAKQVTKSIVAKIDDLNL